MKRFVLGFTMAVAMALGAGQSNADIQWAGDKVIDLDASDLPLGPATTWANKAGLGGDFTVVTKQPPPVGTALPVPVVKTSVPGQRGVAKQHVEFKRAAGFGYGDNPSAMLWDKGAPAAITAGHSFSVEGWVYLATNDQLQTFFSMGRRESCSGETINNFAFSAGGGGADGLRAIGMNNPANPQNLDWLDPIKVIPGYNYFAGTYDSATSTVSVYLNGELNNSLVVPDPGLSITTGQPVYLGAMWFNASGKFLQQGLHRGGISVLRVHGDALSEAQVLENFDFERLDFMQSTAADILTFGPGAVITGNDIAWTVPYGTNLTGPLAPTFTMFPGATAVPPSGTSRIFSTPQTYTVTASDSGLLVTKVYTVTVSAAPSAMVVNNSFEVSDPLGNGNYGYAPSGATWIFSSTAGIAANGSPWYVPNALDGSRGGFIQFTAGRISQDVTFAVGGDYRLSFHAVGRAGYGSIDMSVEIDGSQVLALEADDISTATWGTYTSEVFTLSAGTHTLAFINGAGDGDLANVIDNVWIDLVDNEARILTFGLPGMPAAIQHSDQSASTITWTVPHGTNPTSLAPTFTVSAGATAAPPSGTARDFTAPQTYVVTAQDGSTTRVYTVSVVVEQFIRRIYTLSSESFVGYNPKPWIPKGDLPLGSILRSVSVNATIEASDGDGWASDLAIFVDPTPEAFGGDGLLQIGGYDNLGTPLKVDWRNGACGPGCSVTDEKVAGVDFPPDPGCYGCGEVDLGTATLFVANSYGITTTWTGTITVTCDIPGPASIFTFGLDGIPAFITGTDIAWTVPFKLGSEHLTELAPTFTVSAGATAVPPSGTVRNFTTPQTYVVTSQGGATVNTYTVRVTVTPVSTAKDMLTFGLPGMPKPVIAGTDIAWTVPFATNVTTIGPTYTVSPLATEDVSYPSGWVRDFTTPQTYTITAEDGSTKTYTITVTVAGENDGLGVRTYDDTQGASFLNPISNLIAVAPSGRDAQLLDIAYPADFGFAASFPGLSDDETFSILWTGWFDVSKDGPGEYTFGTESDDGSVLYLDLNDDGEFTSPDELVVDNNLEQPPAVKTATVTLDMDLVRVAVGFWENGGGQAMTARFKKGSGIAWGCLDPINGISGHFFFARSGDILTFGLPGLPAVISGARIDWALPSGTDVTHLAPTYTVSSFATGDPPSGTTRDFTNPVKYSVTADDGTTKNYTVTVTFVDAGVRFHRGDADASGPPSNITDGIYILNYLFTGGDTPPCFDAADTDNSGTHNITDGIYILNYLFTGGPEPPPPLDGCGLEEPGDPTPLMGCAEYKPCQ